MINQYITAVGLILDIIGVVTLFYTGLPYKFPELDSYTEIFIADKDLPHKNRKQKIVSYFGLTFLVCGFLVQLIGTLLSI